MTELTYALREIDNGWILIDKDGGENAYPDLQTALQAIIDMEGEVFVIETKLEF